MIGVTDDFLRNDEPHTEDSQEDRVRLEEFALALIKGAVEGDPYRHFGSLLGVNAHAAPLLRAGLLVACDPPSTAAGEDHGVDFVATEAGRDLYERHQLATLPAGRASFWIGVTGERRRRLQDASREVAALTRHR